MIQEFLQELDLPEFAAADEAYRVAEARVTSIAARQRDFLAGRTAGTQKIELALAKQDEDPALLEEAALNPARRQGRGLIGWDRCRGIRVIAKFGARRKQIFIATLRGTPRAL